MKPSRKKSVKVKSITVYKMLHLIALIDDGDDDYDDDSITSFILPFPFLSQLYILYFAFPYYLFTAYFSFV